MLTNPDQERLDKATQVAWLLQQDLLELSRAKNTLLADIGFNGFDSHRTLIIEGNATITDQAGTMQEVVDHYGFEHIQLKVSVGTADIDGHIISHHLGSNHGKRFTLGGVYLAGHDGRSGFVIGNKEFADTAAGTGREHPYIIGDLHQTDRYCF